MKGKWFSVVSAVWFAMFSSLLAHTLSPQYAQMSRSLPAMTIMTCQNGQYSEGASRQRNGDNNCQRQPNMSATAIAITVGRSSYAKIDSPPCQVGNTDATVLALTRTQVGTVVNGAQLYSQLQRRAELLGNDASRLIQASPEPLNNTSSCQLFVLRVPVRASDIRVIEFRAHQNQASDNRRCFEARPSRSKSEYVASPASGACAIRWSGWQSATIVDDPRANGALVSAVFKNWSSEWTRTGEVWVWYGGSATNQRIPPRVTRRDAGR
jgi:hypothetical protein